MKVAFVPPWYGPDIPGGAEALARSTAEHLHQSGIPVEVLTTCVRDFHAPWGRNHHRPGASVVNGVTVRRFAVRRRRVAAFDAVNQKLMSGLSISPREERVFVEENVRSPSLERYLARNAHRYLYVFIPYVFGTTYWGVKACGGNGMLIPCLHDEPYARLSVFRQTVEKSQHLILNSEAERRLIEDLYGLPPSQSTVMGTGVDTGWTGDGRRFIDANNFTSPFVLYAGRRSRAKNVHILVEYFRRYRRSRRQDVDLVLIGSGSLEFEIAPGEGIHDLGFVTVQEKYDAYAAATVLCQPSLHESFSLVIMEGWLAGIPALVHGNCAVTREHCVRSNAGLYFTGYPEFETCLDVLLGNRALRDKMGSNGRQYVQDNYEWSVVTRRFRELFAWAGVT